MKILLGYCVLCIFLAKVQSNPQITKLFPVKELAKFHEKTNEIKPLDKFLLKLRATYNFVFNKAEDTSNVEKILANDAPNPDVETLKLIWANVISPLPDKSKDDVEVSTKLTGVEGRTFENNGQQNAVTSNDKASEQESAGSDSNDDWLNGVEAPKPRGELELQEDSDDDSDVESITPHSTLQLPMALGRHLLEWLGALLGLTYGAYTRVAQAIKT